MANQFFNFQHLFIVILFLGLTKGGLSRLINEQIESQKLEFKGLVLYVSNLILHKIELVDNVIRIRIESVVQMKRKQRSLFDTKLQFDLSLALYTGEEECFPWIKELNNIVFWSEKKNKWAEFKWVWLLEKYDYAIIDLVNKKIRSNEKANIINVLEKAIFPIQEFLKSQFQMKLRVEEILLRSIIDRHEEWQFELMTGASLIPLEKTMSKIDNFILINGKDDISAKSWNILVNEEVLLLLLKNYLNELEMEGRKVKIDHKNVRIGSSTIFLDMVFKQMMNSRVELSFDVASLPGGIEIIGMDLESGGGAKKNRLKNFVYKRLGRWIEDRFLKDMFFSYQQISKIVISNIKEQIPDAGPETEIDRFEIDYIYLKEKQVDAQFRAAVRIQII